MGGCAPSRPVAEVYCYQLENLRCKPTHHCPPTLQDGATASPSPPLNHINHPNSSSELRASTATSIDGSTAIAGPCAVAALAHGTAAVDEAINNMDAYDVDVDIVPFFDEGERLATLLSLGMIERPQKLALTTSPAFYEPFSRPLSPQSRSSQTKQYIFILPPASGPPRRRGKDLFATEF